MTTMSQGFLRSRTLVSISSRFIRSPGANCAIAEQLPSSLLAAFPFGACLPLAERSCPLAGAFSVHSHRSRSRLRVPRGTQHPEPLSQERRVAELAYRASQPGTASGDRLPQLLHRLEVR